MNVSYHPIALKLDGQPVTVVGGGPVAERKILSLIGSGARVTVISPAITPGLKKFVKNKSLAWYSRTVAKNDLADAKIVIAATSNKNVNRNVSRWAKEFGVWVNVVDDSRLSNFISPAVFRTGKAIVAVYTDGKYPEMSRDLKNFLKERWDDFLSFRNRS